MWESSIDDESMQDADAAEDDRLDNGPQSSFQRGNDYGLNREDCTRLRLELRRVVRKRTRKLVRRHDQLDRALQKDAARKGVPLQTLPKQKLMRRQEQEKLKADVRAHLQQLSRKLTEAQERFNVNPNKHNAERAKSMELVLEYFSARIETTFNARESPQGISPQKTQPAENSGSIDSETGLDYSSTRKLTKKEHMYLRDFIAHRSRQIMEQRVEGIKALRKVTPITHFDEEVPQTHTEYQGLKKVLKAKEEKHLRFLNKKLAEAEYRSSVFPSKHDKKDIAHVRQCIAEFETSLGLWSDSHNADKCEPSSVSSHIEQARVNTPSQTHPVGSLDTTTLPPRAMRMLMRWSRKVDESRMRKASEEGFDMNSEAGRELQRRQESLKLRAQQYLEDSTVRLIEVESRLRIDPCSRNFEEHVCLLEAIKRFKADLGPYLELKIVDTASSLIIAAGMVDDGNIGPDMTSKGEQKSMKRKGTDATDESLSEKLKPEASVGPAGKALDVEIDNEKSKDMKTSSVIADNPVIGATDWSMNDCKSNSPTFKRRKARRERPERRGKSRHSPAAETLIESGQDLENRRGEERRRLECIVAPHLDDLQIVYDLPSATRDTTNDYLMSGGIVTRPLAALVPCQFARSSSLPPMPMPKAENKTQKRSSRSSKFSNWLGKSHTPIPPPTFPLLNRTCRSSPANGPSASADRA
ncbi:hypothetical protein BJ170DRAFT_24528 [Xylariales sp. AK1849]|nr:hypothetical protein BJ170DRAFT_24528 [Xylariales sp. AK1849]